MSSSHCNCNCGTPLDIPTRNNKNGSLKCWSEKCGVDSGNRAYSSFTPISLANNSDAVIIPKGDGAFALSTTVQNQVRGKRSVDLQLSTTNQRGASGEESFVAGANNSATGVRAVALGSGNTASGAAATALGSGNTASGAAATALGTGTVASGVSSLAAGHNNVNATGRGAVAFGSNPIRSIGRITASGEGALALGHAAKGNIESTAPGSMAFGAVGNAPVPSPAVPAGFIIASNHGAIAHGRAMNNATISSSAAGGVARGLAITGDIICDGAGALCQGYPVGSNTLMHVQREASGAIVTGLPGADRVINTNQKGHMIAGDSSYGSVVHGYSHGVLKAGDGNAGSFVGGYADGLSIISTLDNEIHSHEDHEEEHEEGEEEPPLPPAKYAGFAHGFVDGENEKILADGNSSLSKGRNVRVSNDYGAIIGEHGTAINFNNSSLETRDIQGDASVQFAGGIYDHETTLPPQGVGVVIGHRDYGNVPVSGIDSTFFNASGTAYSEYLEWVNAPEPDNDCGYFVALDFNNVGNTDKIRIATSNDEVVGVVLSKRARNGFVGNAAELYFNRAFNTDEFGRVESALSIKQRVREVLRANGVILTSTSTNPVVPDLEPLLNQYDNTALIDEIANTDLFTWTHGSDHITVIVQLTPDQKAAVIAALQNLSPIRTNVPNPIYNPELPYIPRSARPEWSPVALLGQVNVRDDGNVTPGSLVSCNIDGTAIEDQQGRWRVMRRVSPNVITIMFK